MTGAGWRWPAGIGLLCATACVAVALGGSSTLRTLVVIAFLLLCPGMAVVRAIGVGDPWAQLSLGLGLSVAIDTLVSGVVALAGVWSPSAILLILVAVSLSGAALDLRRLARSGEPAT
jgi:uncharacterized membrane protein